MTRLSKRYISHHASSFIDFCSYFLAHYFGVLNADQKALMELKNKFQNRPCFIIGNGPSLSINDLQRIHDLGAVSIASNRIYLAFPNTDWRPDAYTISDELIIRDSIDTIKEQNLLKIVPMRKKKIINGNGAHGSVIGFRALLHKPTEVSKYQPNPSINGLKGFFTGQTITTLNIQLAAWLGCKNIFIIGLDGSYKTGTEKAPDKDYGVVLRSKGEANHFHPDYRPKNELWAIPRTDLHEKEYSSCVTLLENNNFNVYNASRTSVVKAFKRISIEKAFEICNANR